MARQSRAHNTQLHLYPSLGIPSRGGVGSGPYSHLSSAHTRQRSAHQDLTHGTRYDGRAHETNTTRQRRKIRNALNDSVAIHVHSVLPGLLRQTNPPIPENAMQRVQTAKQSPPSLAHHTSTGNSEQYFGILQHSQTLPQGSLSEFRLVMHFAGKGAEGISTNVTVTAVKQQCLLYLTANDPALTALIVYRCCRWPSRG
ncbi:hypothetical protein HRbin28_01446 [bacterium HR28]|nr:hypothetical protein HRbin28_01446 [bacterium HR28]